MIEANVLLRNNLTSYIAGVLTTPIFSIIYSLSYLGIAFTGIFNWEDKKGLIHLLQEKIYPESLKYIDTQYFGFDSILYLFFNIMVIAFIFDIILIFILNNTFIEHSCDLRFENNTKFKQLIRFLIKYFLIVMMFLGLNSTIYNNSLKIGSVLLLLLFIILDLFIRQRSKGSETLLLKLVNLKYKNRASF